MVYSETHHVTIDILHMFFSLSLKLCIDLGGKLFGFTVPECMMFCHLLWENTVVCRCDGNVNSVEKKRIFSL